MNYVKTVFYLIFHKRNYNSKRKKKGEGGVKKGEKKEKNHPMDKKQIKNKETNGNVYLISGS